MPVAPITPTFARAMPIRPGFVPSAFTQAPAASPNPTKCAPAGSSSVGSTAVWAPEMPIAPMWESDVPTRPGADPPAAHTAADVSQGAIWPSPTRASTPIDLSV